jgi:hypothetical protein
LSFSSVSSTLVSLTKLSTGETISSSKSFSISLVLSLKVPLCLSHGIWVDIMVDDKKGFMDEDWSFINGSRDFGNMNESSTFSTMLEAVDDSFILPKSLLPLINDQSSSIKPFLSSTIISTQIP